MAFTTFFFLLVQWALFIHGLSISHRFHDQQSSSWPSVLQDIHAHRMCTFWPPAVGDFEFLIQKSEGEMVAFMTFTFSRLSYQDYFRDFLKLLYICE